MILSIDLSLRSTGLTLQEQGQLIDFCIVSNKDQDEALLKKNAEDVLNFIKGRSIDVIVIEGLSFASKSGSKDIIAGNFWYLRCALKELFSFDFHIVPVTRWRKTVISKDRVKELEKELGKEVITKNKKGKEVKKIKMPAGWQKRETVRCLPSIIKEQFENYLQKGKFKKNAIFDLADSYFLGRYIQNET